MNYYSRTGETNSDGTTLFANSDDNQKQSEVSCLIEAAFGPGLKMKQFGRLCPIDFYAERDGRMCALLEVKCRSHLSTQFGTVFLNVRKWLALTMGSVGFGVPAFFVVRFADKVLYINVADVDASSHRIGGTKKIVKSSSDKEPVIEVEVSAMKEIHCGR